MSSFKSLGLISSLLETIEKKGYVKATPIQEKSIPPLLEGRDVLGIAQTGTGKTAAFGLPILNKLILNKKKTLPNHTRCLILTPTRELAAQIEENLKEYSKGLGLKTTTIYGGVNQRIQIKKLVKGMDIIVATPGRLLDLMNGDHILLNQLETFVLDEADRMLDMGFINDIKKIIYKLPRNRQTLMYSATMPSDIEKLSSKILKNPLKVEVSQESSTVEKINQVINFVEKEHKVNLLREILKNKSIKQALVFTKTKHGANKVVKNLDTFYIKSAAIHGNKSQSARMKSLKSFKEGKIRVLVATDIAARGIDIKDITHVINYNLPEDPKNYVHRIGRTARAGKSGNSISFCEISEKNLLENIEKSIKYKIPVDKTHKYHGIKSKNKSNKRSNTGKRQSSRT